MDGRRSALELWREKLEHLLAEEAIASDPEKKFQLTVQLREARQKIADLEAQKESRHFESPEPRGIKPRRNLAMFVVVGVGCCVFAVFLVIALPLVFFQFLPPWAQTSPSYHTHVSTPTPTPVAARLLIFGNHFQKDRVYIVNKTLGSNIRDNNTYIQETCSGPDQILWLNWDNDARPDALLGRSSNTPFQVGKYTVTRVEEIIRDENIRIHV